MYLKPNSNWKQASARFAAYFFGGDSNEWADMADTNGDGTYEVELPDAKYSNIIFARMDGSTNENNWDNRWNQTVNLDIQLGHAFTIMDEYWALGSWSNVDMKTNKLYLIPNSNWQQSGARFAAYFFGNGEKWVDMVHIGDNVYSVEIPSGYPNVIFCRMNPNTTANNWNNKWNQTGDLNGCTATSYHGKVFEVPSGSWDGSTSSWNQLFN